MYEKVAELVVADSCKLQGLEQLPNSSSQSKKSKKLTKILLTQHKEQVESEEFRFHCLPSAGKISHTLIQWIWTMSDPLLLWYRFNPQNQPLDLKDPKIDITIDYPIRVKKSIYFDLTKLSNVIRFQVQDKSSQVNIETLFGECLFEGFLENGRVQGKVDPERVNHPGWKGRLVLGILESGAPKIDRIDKV